jgi:hypothetical protein
LKICYIGSLKFCCYYLQYVPPSKAFDQARFAVLDAEDNIKMDPQEVGGGDGDWMELAQDRDRWRALVGTVRKFRVP